MNINEVRIDAIYDRYCRLTRVLPPRLRWFAYLLAPGGISATTFAAGLLCLSGAVGTTLAVTSITPDGASRGVAMLLVAALICQSIGHWAKERQETLLTVAVRQITYRRFKDIFSAKQMTAETRGHVLTHPGQISQFAFALDFLLSLIQIVAFLTVSLTLFGANAAVAALVIGVLAYISIRLVHHVGRLWEAYIGLEGERRQWLQRVCDALPRGQYLPSWHTATHKLSEIRGREEELLRRRVPLQALNGFLERGALTALLALVAVLAVLVWPGAGLGIGILLAARYLYAAVQNNIVNYRVIRLAVPMMVELDRLESADRPHAMPKPSATRRRDRVEIVTSPQAFADTISEAVSEATAGYVPHNPELSAPLLTAWRDQAGREQLLKFTGHAATMGLNEAVVERLWHDPASLSSGERHRAAVALVLADGPEWLVLDDTFSALDAPLREQVAVEVLRNVPSCTLLARSPEYTPTAMQAKDIALGGADASVECSRDSLADRPVDSVEAEKVALPDPVAKRATFAHVVGLLFGPQSVWIVVGAVMLAGAEVVFAVSLGRTQDMTERFAWVSAGCAIMALAGTVLFYWPQYSAPITRLTKLHDALVTNLTKYASPKSSGPTVARLGEDFSDLQMSVPGALAASILVVVQTVLLIGAASAGAPEFLVVAMVLIPVAVVTMRLGKTKILSAATVNANRRGDFLGVVSMQAGLKQTPVSAGLNRAGTEAYKRSESAYLKSSISVANAYALRTGLIQALVLMVSLSAVVLVLVVGAADPVVTPAAVIYFALTLGGGIAATIETLHDVGVVGLTAERVRSLADFKTNHTRPQSSPSVIKQLDHALAQGDSLIAVVGPSGVGKSLLLDTVCERAAHGEVCVVADVDPFALELSDRSGLSLADKELTGGTARLILLDETFKSLTPEQERAELGQTKKVATETGKTVVVVLHSNSNLDMFDAVVRLGD